LDDEVRMLDQLEDEAFVQVSSYSSGDAAKPFASGAAAAIKPSIDPAEHAAAKAKNQGTHKAKDICVAAWSETKKQCMLLDAATESVEKVQSAITNAGKAIIAAANEAAAKPGTKPDVERIEMAFSQLGEDASHVPASKAAMAALGCQQLWQGVESLCRSVKTEAATGAEAVKTGAKKGTDFIQQQADHASKMKVVTVAQKKGYKSGYESGYASGAAPAAKAFASSEY